ncbi:hypothetical protein BKA64DRAFT_383004 [Cadophora sp. MPI-SDFR-AT-0126]|nr:hypothetical protein BKA64DRAFT_383004 [Leotiomycetes sp. MPI-SDFR-AT-0126]
MSFHSQEERPPRSRDPTPRDHLPQKQTYLQLCTALTHRYPVLNYLNAFVSKKSQPGPLYPVRTAVLEFYAHSVVRIDFDSSDGVSAYSKLSAYLTSLHQCKNRLFLLEDLSPEFIELLGGYLNIDGTVFAHQIRDAHYSGGPWNGHPPQLPSEIGSPQGGFTLRYYEPRYLDDPDLPAFSSAVQTLGNVARPVTFGKPTWNEQKNQEGHVGHVRHNTSFWSTEDGEGGWNGIVSSSVRYL